MDNGQILRVRAFNRAVTQRIGALDDSFLNRGRPLGEARLLYEIRNGAEVRELRARLGLDSGYVSRLLRSLERQHLIEAHPVPGDARVRRVALTAAGAREVAELDRLSDGFAESVLAPLGEHQRQRLVAAMDEVERLMRAFAVDIRPEPPDTADARWCLNEYFRDLAQRFETGFDPDRSNPATAAEMTPPAGIFLVARLDGHPVGCAALKVKGGAIGEIKRMWVHPDTRGIGIGRRILAAVEEQARAFGLAVLRLETNRSLTEAQALYHKGGYREVAPFNDEPYAHHWFEKPVA